MYSVVILRVLCSKEGEYKDVVGTRVRECVINRAV